MLSKCQTDLTLSTQFASGPFPLPPYYKARFSNGRVWIELVAATFGDELEDFATGNAISGATGEAPGQFMVQPPYANMSSAKEVFVPSTLEQVCVFHPADKAMLEAATMLCPAVLTMRLAAQAILNASELLH